MEQQEVEVRHRPSTSRREKPTNEPQQGSTSGEGTNVAGPSSAGPSSAGPSSTQPTFFDSYDEAVKKDEQRRNAFPTISLPQTAPAPVAAHLSWSIEERLVTTSQTTTSDLSTALAMPRPAPLLQGEVMAMWEAKRNEYRLDTGRDLVDVIRLHESTQILEDSSGTYERITARAGSGNRDFPSLQEHLENSIGVLPPRDYSAIIAGGMEVWIYLPALLITTPYLFNSCGYRAKRAHYEQTVAVDALAQAQQNMTISSTTQDPSAEQNALMNNAVLGYEPPPHQMPQQGPPMTVGQLRHVWEFRRREYQALYAHNLEDGIRDMERRQKEQDAKDKFEMINPEAERNLPGFVSLAQYLDMVKGTSPVEGFEALDVWGREIWMRSAGSLVTTPYLFHSHRYRQRRANYWAEAWKAKEKPIVVQID